MALTERRLLKIRAAEGLCRGLTAQRTHCLLLPLLGEARTAPLCEGPWANAQQNRARVSVKGHINH